MLTARQASKWQKTLAVLTGSVSTFVLVLGLYWGRPILVPIAVSILLTLLLSPVVQWLERIRIPHVFAVLFTVFSAAGVLAALAGLLGSQASHMLAELPRNTEKIKAKIRTVRELGAGQTAQRFGGMVNEINQELKPDSPEVNAQSAGATESASTSDHAGAEPLSIGGVTTWGLITKHLGSAMEVLGGSAFSFVLIVFFLMENREWRDRLVVLAGKARLSVTSKALQEMNDRITRYLTMMALLNGGYGLCLAAMLYLLGMPYSMLWGCLAAMMRFIPFIGPWIGAIFPISMSIALSDSVWQPLAVAGAILVLELLSNNVLEPLVYGRATGISLAALMISAAFWLFLWGPLGMVLSIPIAVCLIVIGKHVPQLSFLQLILGDEPALTADASYYHRLMLGDSQEAMAIVKSYLQGPDAKNVNDELLIPTLNAAKRDRRRNLISTDDYQSILNFIRAALTQIDELIHSRQDVSAPVHRNNGRAPLIVGYPSGDDTDRLALEILQSGLGANGREVEIAAPAEDPAALVDRIVAATPAVICIAAIPPGDLASTRQLCDRLRAAVPEVPIIVGRWGQSGTNSGNPRFLWIQGASFVHTTQAETCQTLREHFSQIGVRMAQANS